MHSLQMNMIWFKFQLSHLFSFYQDFFFSEQKIFAYLVRFHPYFAYADKNFAANIAFN